MLGRERLVAFIATANAKRARQFERFPSMQQDGSGIWNTPSGALVAWFKDPDGNVLSLTQGR